MSDQVRLSHPAYRFLPKEIEGFDSMAELALDLRWSWSHATDGVWRTLDPLLWKLTHNPWIVLQTVARSDRPSARRHGREICLPPAQPWPNTTTGCSSILPRFQPFISEYFR
jgi:hypothetical protein